MNTLKLSEDNTFTYTGKSLNMEDLGQEEVGVFYDNFNDKFELKGYLKYIATHGTVKDGNLRRKFGKSVEREHGKPLIQEYDDTINFLIKNGFLVEGEPGYRITGKGIRGFYGSKNGSLSCSTDLSCIMKNLIGLHNSGKIRKPPEYLEPVGHFLLLGEVEADNQDIIEKADFFNSCMRILSREGLVEMVMPDMLPKIEFLKPTIIESVNQPYNTVYPISSI